MPEIYYLQKRVELHGPWVDGGYSQQPHILMMEFEVCRTATQHFITAELPALEKQHNEH